MLFLDCLLIQRDVLRIVKLFEQRMRYSPMYDVLSPQLNKSLNRFPHLSDSWGTVLACLIIQCGGFLEQFDGSNTSSWLIQKTVSLLDGLREDTDDTILSIKLAQQFEGFYFQAAGICLNSGKNVAWNSLTESFHAFARHTAIVDLCISSPAHISESEAASWFQAALNGGR